MISISKIKIPLLIFLILLFAQCSVNYTFTGASVPIEAKTFSIKPFDNFAPTVNPQLASSLTDQLYMKIMTSTSLTSQSFDGDMAFEGTVVGYSLSPLLSRGDASVAEQTRLTITVKVKFQNRYNSKDNYEASFSQYADFESSASFSSVEQTLMEDVVEELVKDIFNKAFVNW